MIPWNELESDLDLLFLAARRQDIGKLLMILGKIVPEYTGMAAGRQGRNLPF